MGNHVSKYRLYDKQDDAMYEVTSITWDGGNIRSVGANGRTYEFTEDGENWPVMQATGIRDQHGIEIYEGDIVKHKDPSDVFRHYTKEPKFRLNVVEWVEKAAGFKVINGPMVLISSAEVLGNIYQNPELAEK